MDEIQSIRSLIKKLQDRKSAFCLNTRKPTKRACKYLMGRKDLMVHITGNLIQISPK